MTDYLKANIYFPHIVPLLEKIVKMQESKRNLADAILSGENGSISQMSKEELMELLEG